MDPFTALISSRLESLQRAVEAGDTVALDVFWQEASAGGTPLVEPIPGNDRDCLVTFLRRNGKDDGRIGLISNLAGGMGEYEEMCHMPGTDLWYKTHQVPKDTRETYQFSIDGQNSIDPFNYRKFIFPLDEDTGVGGWESSILELPDAPPQPWILPKPGVPKGQVRKHYYQSRILGNQYPVWLYTPPGYSAEGDPYGFLVLLDGWFYANLMPAPTILDNLLAEGKLPPLVAIMIGSLSYGQVRKRDYGCYPPYIDFLTKELMPWARQEVHLTNDPSRTAIVGASRGGLMAAYIGLRLPDIFGNVLTQSGSFGWRPEEDREQEWLARQYASNPKAPLRLYLEAGLFETDLMMPDGFSINLLASSRHLRDILHAKEYPVIYREFSGGHSTLIWRGTLADGLLALLGDESHEDRNTPEPAKSAAKPGMHTIQSLARAVHPSFAMLAGCQLGVFTALKDGSLNADQIASALEVDATRLRPLLYALVSAGLLAVDQDCFSNTEGSNTYLVKGNPNYMGPVYDVWAMIWEAEMKSAESIRTGVAQCRHLFDFANKPQAALEKMYRGAHGPSYAYGKLLAERFDFSAGNTVVDVGGGSGGVVIALLQANGHLNATVVELPNVTPVSRLLIEEAGMAERIEVISLDVVKTPLSGHYDSAVLSKVLQTLSAEECQVVLKHVGQALNPGGTIFIFGTVVDDSRQTPVEMAAVNLFFINVYDGGQAFTEGEHRTWLSEAGFENIERELLPDQLSLITAKKKLSETL
jgi:enterochelin esterase-like enzyme/ubiquinone/menaquinone biosynthesis C-methylase UbiE